MLYHNKVLYSVVSLRTLYSVVNLRTLYSIVNLKTRIVNITVTQTLCIYWWQRTLLRKGLTPTDESRVV